ncbi:MAG TPA: phospholipid carrier-dependent glycosyltransferase [Dehalococcoidia bacterium]|nr:phospholipid carrier-dependent glycosyltransferase [Dehalococcoidia bacterium]
MRRAYLLLALVLLATAVLRFPAFFQPDWYGDEGIFAAVADALRHGRLLYAGVWDNKPPGIFLVYAAGQTTGLDMIAVRLMALAATFAVEIIVFLTARRCAGEVAGVAAAAVCALLLGTPIIEGDLANTETFMVVFTTLGMYSLVLRAGGAEEAPLRLLLPGFVFGVALFFKQIAVLDAAGAGIFVCLYYRATWRHVVSYVGGVAIVPMLTAAFFLVAGAFSQFFAGNVGFMLTYRGSAPTLGQLAVQLLPLALALPYAVALQPWRTRSIEALWPLWLAFAAIGVSASGHSYPHYLIQAVPPLSLVLVTWASRRPVLPRVSVSMGMVVGVLAVYQLFLGPWGYVAWNKEPQHTRAYYRNFVDYMDGDRSRQDYEAFFDPKTPDRLRLAGQVANLNLQPRRLFVWGDLPWLYVQADLRPPTRFPVLFTAVEQEGGFEGVARLLAHDPASYVLVLDSDADSWYGIQPLLGADYRAVKLLDNATLYVNDDTPGAISAAAQAAQSCYAEAQCDD